MSKATVIVLCLVLTSSGLIAQSNSSLFEAWSAQPDVALKVTTDWDSLYSIRDLSYIDAELNDGNNDWEVSLRLRGVSRRKDCYYKPFQLNFKKKALRKANFEDFDKFKVVTQCINDEDGIENVYEELLIYKIYNILSDDSFHAFPVALTYVDAITGQEFESVALIIEPNKECFTRLGGEEVEMFNMPADSMEGMSYVRSAMFHFMIGNLDWNTDMQQNVKFVRRDNGLSTVIPYDFDYSAIVAPPYARLNIDFQQTDIEERFYLGKYFSEHIPAVLEEYTSKRLEIEEYILAYPYLKTSRKKQVVRFIDKFFKHLEKMDEPLEYGYKIPVPG